MRMSTVVELLLILLLVAYAAYGRVIDRDEVHHRSVRAASGTKQSNMGLSTMSLKQATDNVNRYCTCNENICNCCRDFHIPLVQLQGPGCASLQYLQGDNLAVQLSFGDNILTSTIVNGKNPKPVCVPLPGGFTKFCGRIYSIQRDAKNHFKACLGLELQSATELEASLRVSCFRFGPDGLKLRPAEPLPVVEAETSDEDDEDDFFGLGGDDDEEDDDDDDDDDEENRPIGNAVPNSSASSDENEDDDEDEDVLGLGALFDIITGGDDTTTKKPKVTTAAPLLHFTIPLLSRPSTVSPLEPHMPETETNSVVPEKTPEIEATEDVTDDPNKENEEENGETTESQAEESDVTAVTNEEEVTEASNKIATHLKPEKVAPNKLKGTAVSKKKPSLTSSSINAITDDTKNKKKKPLKRPVKDEDDEDDDILGDDDIEEDDDDEFLNDDDDEDEDEEKDDEDEDDDNEETNAQKHGEEEEDEEEDEKAEDIEDLDDDEDEEEDAMISALVYDGKDKGKKKKSKAKKPHAEHEHEDDSDYGLGLSGFLARSRHMKNARQSKDMKL